jgi:hypothetical protein
VYKKLKLSVNLDIESIKNSVVTTSKPSAHESKTYYIPEDPAFPVIDAWTKHWFFQITVSHSHPLKTASKLFKDLKGRGVPRGIVFVVPQNMFKTYNAQKLVCANGKDPQDDSGPVRGWNDLPQYVVGVGVAQRGGD